MNPRLASTAAPRRLVAVIRTVALALLAGLLVQPAFAQGRPPPRPTPQAPAPAPVSGKVNVEVMVVHGTDAHDRVDPKVKPVMQQLRFLSFSGFELLSKQDHDIAVGGDHTYAVEGGLRVKVDVISRDAKQARIRLRLFRDKGSIMDSTVNVHRNKSFMIAGPPYEGGVLILPLTARY